VSGRGASGGLAALAAAILVAAGGCGLKKQIDTDRAEAEIKRDLAQQTGAPIRTVRCPDEVKASKGAKFSCRAIADDGSRIPIRVTQTDGNGGVRWRIGR
jgi:predicted secreted protein